MFFQIGRGHEHDQGALVGGQMDSRIGYMDLESQQQYQERKKIKEAIYFRSLKDVQGQSTFLLFDPNFRTKSKVGGKTFS